MDELARAADHAGRRVSVVGERGTSLHHRQPDEVERYRPFAAPDFAEAVDPVRAIAGEARAQALAAIAFTGASGRPEVMARTANEFQANTFSGGLFVEAGVLRVRGKCAAAGDRAASASQNGRCPNRLCRPLPRDNARPAR